MPCHVGRGGGYPWHVSWGYHGLGRRLALIWPRLNKVDPWFPPKSSCGDINKMVGEFTKAVEAMVVVVHVAAPTPCISQNELI